VEDLLGPLIYLSDAHSYTVSQVITVIQGTTLTGVKGRPTR